MSVVVAQCEPFCCGAFPTPIFLHSTCPLSRCNKAAEVEVGSAIPLVGMTVAHCDRCYPESENGDIKMTNGIETKKQGAKLRHQKTGTIPRPREDPSHAPAPKYVPGTPNLNHWCDIWRHQVSPTSNNNNNPKPEKFDAGDICLGYIPYKGIHQGCDFVGCSQHIARFVPTISVWYVMSLCRRREWSDRLVIAAPAIPTEPLPVPAS